MGFWLQKHLEEAKYGLSITRKEALEKLEKREYPLVSEAALIHPLHQSIVKLRDNGNIDIFVGNDNGIRLDPARRSIQILTDKIYEKTHEAKRITSRNHTYQTGGVWKVKAEERVIIESPVIELNGTVIINGKQVENL